MNNLISAIIPVKNGSNYLREAIESLLRQEVSLEIIVVDDGSSDDTAAIASGYGCKVISHPESKGQVAAKNTGLKAASGDYVIFMDHDDVMRDGALRAQYDALEAEPAYSAAQAMVKDFLSPEIEPAPGKRIRPNPYYGLFTGAILIRRKVFDTIGFFSESIHTGEIIEWSSRMAAEGFEIKRLDMVSTDRRIHQTNFGKTDGKVELMNYAQVLRERLKMMGR